MSNMHETPDKSTDAARFSDVVEKPEAVFWCFLFILEAVLITAGNLLTTLVFLRCRKLRTRRYYLIINLTISDTLVGALALPTFLVSFGKSLNVWDKISAVPREVGLVLDMFAGFASIAFLTMISLERLYATLRPFSYRALKSQWYVLLTVIAWVVAGSIPSLHLCLMKYESTSQIIVVTVWVPFLSAQLLIVCVSYLVIWRKVRVVNKSMGKKRTVEKESSLSRICLLVTAMSLVAWLPFIILSQVDAILGSFNFHAFYITKFLHYANSLLNPVLYVVKIPEFKASLTQLFTRNDADSRAKGASPISHSNKMAAQ